MTKIFNIPNTLTILRILLSPVLFIFLLQNEVKLALITFVIIALTDFADGYIARLKNQQSDFGRLLDPLADKFMVLLAIIALTINFNFPIWAIPLILSREIIMIIGLIFFSKNIIKGRTNILGKATTFFQMITIIVFIINLDYKIMIMWFTIILSIITTMVYIIKRIKILKQ